MKRFEKEMCFGAVDTVMYIIQSVMLLFFGLQHKGLTYPNHSVYITKLPVLFRRG